MVTLEVNASASTTPAALFDELAAFEAHLEVAPAVQSVTRTGDGGVGTSYRVELARYGTQGVVTATVTDTTDGERLAWSADRNIEGSWRLRGAGSTTAITIVLDIDRSLLDRLPIGGRLLSRGLGPLLRRAFRRELEPVLESLAASAGGAGARIDDVNVRLDGR